MQTTEKRTLIDEVMETVSSRISARVLLPGARLPSVRAQARTMNVSVSTVVEAYERLAAGGVIISRPGSGFYVSGPAAPLDLSVIAPTYEREVDPLWISRQSLETDETVLKPGCGWLPASWMHEAGMKRSLRMVARSGVPVLTDYATPQGLPELRQVLARRMATSGIEASPAQIMLTDSGTHAIDLLCRFLLEPGDTVLLDDPCYFNFHALLKAHRVRAMGVPYTPQGPDVMAFEAAIIEHAPRLYITNSAIHNPTGAILSPVVAHRVLKLAERAGMTIIEDDIFADFETTPAPRLAAFDGLERVIHIGSFSKTLSASLRCGYIAARPDWISGLVDLKIATTFGSGHMAAEIMLGALTDGGYRKHMETVRARLMNAMEKTAARLTRMGIVPWIEPRAGIFLWCRLPEGVDAGHVARLGLREGIVLAPGNAFSQSQTANGFMRFNVTRCSDERIHDLLERALTAGQI